MRSNSYRYLIALVFSLALFGCGDDNPADTTDGNQSGSLKGRVVDSSDPNQGLAGVTVRVDGTELTALTDENGNFDFGSVDCGDCTVVIDTPDDMNYQESRVEVSVHGGETVDMDVTVLPDSFRPDHVGIEPADARAGALESIHFYMTIDYRGTDVGGNPDNATRPGEGFGEAGDPGSSGDDRADNQSANGTTSEPLPGGYDLYRPTWTIRSESPIGVISREGIFIGTAPGKGEIIATLSNDFVATAQVEVVMDDDVAQIHINPGWFVDVQEGEELYVTAFARNGAGALMDREQITWSVDPAGLGAIEVAEDLSQQDREEIIWSTWSSRPGGFLLDNTPPGEAHISIARFHAAATTPAAGIRGEIRAAVGEFYRPVKAQLMPSGDLVSLEIFPENAQIRMGGSLLFFAFALNEHNRSMRGVEYEWRVEPADLGILETRDIQDHSGNPWDIDPADGDQFVPPHGNDDPDGPPSLGDVTGQPLPDGPMARIFQPSRLGEGVVTVIARDPRTNIELERSTRISVLEQPHLTQVMVEPTRIELFLGEQEELFATALTQDGEIAPDIRFDWVLEGVAGQLDPVDKPHEEEYDSLIVNGDGPTGNDITSPSNPVPTEGVGLSWCLFTADQVESSGTIRVFAYSAEGMIESAEVQVVVRRRK